MHPVSLQAPPPAVSARALEAALARALRVFVRLDETHSVRAMRPAGWSARQTVGHLIDSACNNHRRFVSAQTAAVSRFEPYDQNGWVSCQRHDLQPWSALVARTCSVLIRPSRSESFWRRFNGT